MNQILLLGAGRSSTCLIDYIISHSEEKAYFLTIADANPEMVKSKIKESIYFKLVTLDADDTIGRQKLIENTDLVISMLPPTMHFIVAQDCLKYSKHMLSASYVDPMIRQLDSEAKAKGLVFLFEMGLDPGIDHMSAMKIFDEIKLKGGEVMSFKSHCGGLVAPESDDNPWHYKISWNSRNIVQAGMAGACYLENGNVVKVAYEEMFNSSNLVDIPGLGKLSWYANRDSLSYLATYGLKDLQTMIRTTLRHPDFSYGWNLVIHLKLTSDEIWIDQSNLSHFDFLKIHLNRYSLEPVFNKLTGVTLVQVSSRLEECLLNEKTSSQKPLTMLTSLGLFEKNERINPNAKSSFDVLLQLAELNWKLKKDDKDMIVMLHEIEYLDEEGKLQSIESSLVVKGKDPIRTAMSETVGLPLAIAAELVLAHKIKHSGVIIPTTSDIYLPVLHELERNNIVFNESNN